MKKFFYLAATVSSIILMQSCGGNTNDTTVPAAPGVAQAVDSVAPIVNTVELKQGIDSVMGFCTEGSTEQNIIITTTEGKVLNLPIDANTKIDPSHLIIMAGNTLTATVNTDNTGSHLVGLKNASDGYTCVYVFLVGKWVSADNQKVIELAPAGKIAAAGFSKAYQNWGYFGDVKLTLTDDKNEVSKFNIDLKSNTITVDGVVLKRAQ